MIKIGIASRIWSARADALGSQRESALVMPVALAQALDDAGALAMLLPPLRDGKIAECARMFDGLVLQGGNDISPALYGEMPLSSQSRGDVECDKVEIELLRLFMQMRKPVLGFCRGCQLINVAFGGSLFQDLPSQLAAADTHSDPMRYAELEHEVELIEGGYLHALYARQRGRVNSAHHQGIRRLGVGLEAQALSAKDGLIEAVCGAGDGYVLGVQWHPEFATGEDVNVLSGAVLFDDFVKQTLRARGG